MSLFAVLAQQKRERDVVPAQCYGCRRLSEPRPLGTTPKTWERDIGGQGRYWCPDCVREGRR